MVFITDEDGVLVGHLDDQDREVAIVAASADQLVDVPSVPGDTSDGLFVEI